MKYIAILEYDLVQGEALEWKFANQEEAIDFITICIKEGYTMRLERRGE